MRYYTTHNRPRVHREVHKIIIRVGFNMKIVLPIAPENHREMGGGNAVGIYILVPAEVDCAWMEKVDWVKPGISFITTTRYIRAL